MRLNIHKPSFLEIVFIAPTLILIAVFILLPLLQSLLTSFYHEGAFVGIQNYKELFSDPNFFNLKGFFSSNEGIGALGNNIIWVLIHMPTSIILGAVFALLLNRKVYGRGVIRTFIFIGVTVPMVIGDILARFLFAQGGGIVPAFFNAIGVKTLYVNWLAKPSLALYALILVSIWLWTGYCMILYMSALTTLDESVVQAAEMDGANSMQVLLYVIIPHIKPVTYVIIAMSLIWELKLFDIVYASTGGGPGGATNVLSLEMYRTTFKYLEEGKGASIAVFMMLLCIIPIGFLIRNHVRETL